MTLNYLDRGQEDYGITYQAMREYTRHRTAESPDQIWFVEHFPVFTQGQAGKPEHILNLHHVPLIQTDRGGQITYHGPGQLVAYLLLDLRRYQLGLREVVSLLEKTVIQTLAVYQLEGKTDPRNPGVYVNGDKIASIGLRISKGCCYHGIALNVDMDLVPFSWIHPCGFSDLKMTQIKDLLPTAFPSLKEVKEVFKSASLITFDLWLGDKF